MRKSKIEVYDGPTPYPLLTEPNQAFTPRQIIEQFARNELTAKVFDPTDNINEDNYSDDQMADNVITFEDEFDAMEFMNTTKVVKNEPEKNESTQDADDGDKDTSGQDAQ